jgi:hypothetical protein
MRRRAGFFPAFGGSRPEPRSPARAIAICSRATPIRRSAQRWRPGLDNSFATIETRGCPAGEALDPTSPAKTRHPPRRNASAVAPPARKVV